MSLGMILRRDYINLRYGPNQYLDFFAELTRLPQARSVLDYQETFEKLLAKAGPMDQARQVSCFVGGLREPIRTNVRANKPTIYHQPLDWLDYIELVILLKSN